MAGQGRRLPARRTVGDSSTSGAAASGASAAGAGNAGPDGVSGYTGGMTGRDRAIGRAAGAANGGLDGVSGYSGGMARRDRGAGGRGGEEAAREVCLRMLESAPKTREQLAKALRRRQVPQDIADTVLGRLAEVGLIDDAAFAQAWVESRHHSRGLARRALAAELRQRGVAADEVRAAVGTVRPEDEAEAARRLVRKRVPATRGKPFPTRVRQLAGVLARKGYPPGLAYQVVREELAADGATGTAAWDDSAPDDPVGDDITDAGWPAAAAAAADEYHVGEDL